MKIDREKPVQLVNDEGAQYVLLRAEKYKELLKELESLDSALIYYRAQGKSARKAPESSLEIVLDPEQMEKFSRAKTFGRRLGLLRSFRGLTQKQLAERSGIGQPLISNLENDNVARPAFSAVFRLLKELEIPETCAYTVWDGVSVRERSTEGISR